MKPHPLASLFPPMSDEEFSGLKASIQEHGLLDPIVTLDGLILDGLNRWRACQELGIKPSSILFEGADPLSYVLDKNLRRRHLDESQRSMIAARLTGLNTNGAAGAKGPIGPFKVKDAASLFRVAEMSVKRGRKVLTGQPDLIRAVERGVIAVSLASSLVGLDAKAQSRIALEKDDRKRKQIIREAKAKAKEHKRTSEGNDLVLTAPKELPDSYYTVERWNKLPRAQRQDIIDAGFEATGQGLNEQTGTSIEWARYSHNTVTGCLHDCPYCYARDIAERLYPQKFRPVFHPGRLAGPRLVSVQQANALKDASYRNIFANSMSDLFGQWVPKDWITATIEMAKRNPQWNFLTLTKFPQRAKDFEFPDNWWMGTTVDAQARVANAEKAFAKIQCKTKWLSIEPLLEPLRFERLDLFQWVVIGGASESRKTPKWIPPFEWIARLHTEAKSVGAKVYHKTNLELPEVVRVREFPWAKDTKAELPRAFRYLKGM